VRGKRPTVWGRTSVSACFIDLWFGLPFPSVMLPQKFLWLNDFACQRASDITQSIIILSQRGHICAI
jgi:hypothetical protein